MSIICIFIRSNELSRPWNANNLHSKRFSDIRLWLWTLPVRFTFALLHYMFTASYVYFITFLPHYISTVLYVYCIICLLYYMSTVLYVYCIIYLLYYISTVIYVYCIMHCIRIFGESVYNLCCIDMVLHSKRPVVHMHPEFTVLWLEFRWCNVSRHIELLGISMKSSEKDWHSLNLREILWAHVRKPGHRRFQVWILSKRKNNRDILATHTSPRWTGRPWRTDLWEKNSPGMTNAERET